MKYVDLIPTTKSESIRARYEAKIEGLDARAKELKKELENKKDPKFEEVLDLALKFLGSPAETWEKADKKLKIQIHGLIFEENPRYSFQGGFGSPKLSLPFYINQHIGTPESLVVDRRGFEPRTSSMPWRRSTS